MKKHPMLSLLSFVLLVPSLGGSVTQAGQESKVTLPSGKPKLIRTLGSDRHAETRCGLQDKAGTLWFGTTDEGVYRYDGKSFTQYTVKDGLTSNTIWSILEDKKGRIWFGTDGGLSRWDGNAFRAISTPTAIDLTPPGLLEPNHPHPEKITVWSMLEDKKGTIWFGTSEGVLCEKDGVISVFLEKNKALNPGGLKLKMVDDILEDRQGNLWFASGMPPGMEGLCRYDGSSITSFKPGGARWIRTVKADPKGILWLGTRNQGVWLYDGKAFSRYSEQTGLGMPLLVDRSGNIWFSGEEADNGFENKTGIWRYDGKTFRNFSTKDGLGNFGVWCMVEDRDGNIWVGTRNTGLYRYDGKSFTRFSE